MLIVYNDFHVCSVIGSMGIPTTGGGVPLPAMTGAALAVPPVTVPSAESVGVPSECLLLNNMFDPELEVSTIRKSILVN